MDTKRLKRVSEYEWRIERAGKMRVDGVIFASAKLIRDMDEKVYEQITNVAALPGIVRASFAMPDAHWGYGFPIRRRCRIRYSLRREDTAYGPEGW